MGEARTKGNLERAVLRVLDERGQTCGAAFIFASGKALTCAHVVRKAGGTAGATIRLAAVNGKEVFSARVDVNAFDEALDAAVLHLEECDTAFQPLTLAPSVQHTGKTVRALGFPPTGKDHAWAEGRILGRVAESTGRKLLQIDSKQLRAGFSGAPLWLEEAGGVIGMQVEVVNPQRRDLPEDTAYALPSEMFADLHPALALSPPPVLGELFAVPLLPLNYQSRPALLGEVCRILLGEDDHPAAGRRIGIHGMGGVGKSVLAQAVARQEAVRRRFCDGIFWLYIGRKPTKKRLITCQIQVYRAFSPSSPDFYDIATGRQEIGRWLKDRACLIILDDVWEAAPVRRAFELDAPDSRILLTTRDAGVLDTLEAVAVAVDTLEESEALRLLCGECRCKLDDLPQEAGEVARRVGYLPFALNLCASMARRGVPWRDILEALTESDLDFFQNGERTLLSVIHTSIAALPPEVQQRYLELGAFPRGEPIAERAVAGRWKETGSMNRRDAGKLITLLKDQHLLRRVEGTSPDRLLWLHDLQYDYIRWQARRTKSSPSPPAS